MELKINHIPEHGYKCIVVPSERLKNPVSDYKTIVSGKEKFKIVQWVTILKSDMIPSSLLLLAIGDVLEPESIYKKYKNSNKLYFFICEKL